VATPLAAHRALLPTFVLVQTVVAIAVRWLLGRPRAAVDEGPGARRGGAGRGPGPTETTRAGTRVRCRG
jgi:hypothetical protein